VLLALSLVGCSSTRVRAPISEAAKPRRDLSAKPLPRHGVYVIQAGDTLFNIAFQRGLDYRDLARWNALDDPDHIVAGTVLRLTPPNKPAVPRPRYAVTPAVVRSGRSTPSSVQEDPEPTAWVWPIQGTVLRSFDDGPNSKGIDIAAAIGTPIHAAADGRVMYAGDGLRGYGKLIIIKHGNALLSAYAHQSALLVREGDRVTRGQKIGEVGDTDATRPELHFEIREHGRPVNPLKYLPI
jgi:lipoprotein NlpD